MSQLTLELFKICKKFQNFSTKHFEDKLLRLTRKTLAMTRFEGRTLQLPRIKVKKKILVYSDFLLYVKQKKKNKIHNEGVTKTCDDLLQRRR